MANEDQRLSLSARDLADCAMTNWTAIPEGAEPTNGTMQDAMALARGYQDGAAGDPQRYDALARFTARTRAKRMYDQGYAAASAPGSAAR